jgi:hypothetical protein
MCRDFLLVQVSPATASWINFSLAAAACLVVLGPLMYLSDIQAQHALYGTGYRPPVLGIGPFFLLFVCTRVLSAVLFVYRRRSTHVSELSLTEHTNIFIERSRKARPRHEARHRLALQLSTHATPRTVNALLDLLQFFGPSSARFQAVIHSLSVRFMPKSSLSRLSKSGMWAAP